jgi:cytoskeletal protein RodZ
VHLEQKKKTTTSVIESKDEGEVSKKKDLVRRNKMTTEIDDDVESSFTRIKQFLESSIPSFEPGKDGGHVSARDSILRQVTEAYHSPLTDDLSIILKRNVGEAKARELLFAPVFSEDSADGMALYPNLISGPPLSQGGANAPLSHPARKVQAISMFLLYISHLRYWQRAKAFVLAGGLQSLVALFNCENLAIKSQAIDSFQQISGHPAFDWFAGRGDNTKEEDNEKDNSFQPLCLDKEESHLHSMMLSLGSPSSPLISSLLSNFNSPTWPGGSYLSLQVLAFWLSWARRLHCNGGPLSVSAKVIEALKLWAEREARPEIEREDSNYVIQSSSSQRYSEREERTLAKQLFEDFSRFPAQVEDVQRSLTSPSSQDTSITSSDELKTQNENPIVNISGLSSPTISVSSASSNDISDTMSTSTKPLSFREQVLNKKEIGNVRYRESNWADALVEYTAAISLLDSDNLKRDDDQISFGGLERNSLKSTLYSNRAAAHLRASGYGGDLSPSPSYFASISKLLREPEQRILRNRLFSNNLTSTFTNDINEERKMITNAPYSVRCLLFCIGDATAALTLDPTHGKSLLRKAQALAALGQFDAATAVARACIAASGEGGNGTSKISGKVSELRSNASSFLTFIMALQTQVEVEEEEEEEEEEEDEDNEKQRTSDSSRVRNSGVFNDSVLLDALLSREEFGGLGRTLSKPQEVDTAVGTGNLRDGEAIDPAHSAIAQVGLISNQSTSTIPLASLNDVLAGIAKSSSGNDTSKKSSIPLHLRALMK